MAGPGDAAVGVVYDELPVAAELRGCAAAGLAESAQARFGLSVLAIFAVLMALASARGWGLWVLTGRKKWRRPD